MLEAYAEFELLILAKQDTWTPEWPFNVDGKKVVALMNRGYDLHTSFSAVLNRIDPEKVTEEQRYMSKEILFGFLYGAS